MPPRTCIKNKAQRRKRWQALCLRLLHLRLVLLQIRLPLLLLLLLLVLLLRLLLLKPLLVLPISNPRTLRTGNRSPSQSKANKLGAEWSGAELWPATGREWAGMDVGVGAWAGAWEEKRKGLTRLCHRHSMSLARCQGFLREQCPSIIELEIYFIKICVINNFVNISVFN